MQSVTHKNQSNPTSSESSDECGFKQELVDKNFLLDGPPLKRTESENSKESDHDKTLTEPAKVIAVGQK